MLEALIKHYYDLITMLVFSVLVFLLVFFLVLLFYLRITMAEEEGGLVSPRTRISFGGV